VAGSASRASPGACVCMRCRGGAKVRSDAANAGRSIYHCDTKSLELGFPIVSAKLWGLRSAAGACPERRLQLLSGTFVHNELMRRCLLRRQSESLAHRVRALSTMLARCRIKRRDTVGEPTSKF
jgi:hypothetical protein